MSVKIIYQNSTFAQLPFLIEDTKQALAVDALDFIFNSLHENTERLEAKIILLSKAEGDGTRNQSTVRTTIADVWPMIDNAFRATELLKHLDYPFDATDLNFIKEIKAIRNSYQHLNDRIKEHFIDNGGSVFGELTWFHRSLRHEGLWHSVLMSGVIVKRVDGGFENTFTIGGDSGDDGIPGVFRVRLLYVIKLNGPNTKTVTLKTVTELDTIAAFVNKVIARLEHNANLVIDGLKKEQAENPDSTIGAGLPPAILHFPVASSSNAL